jgi:hypothetical protein
MARVIRIGRVLDNDAYYLVDIRSNEKLNVQ